MPTRNEETTKKEQPVAKKAAVAPKKATPAPKKEDVKVEDDVVRKSPLQEKFKKMCEEAEVGLSGKINDISERMLKDEDRKVPMVFATFSPNGAADESVDDAFNVECIKKMLFAYHTLEEKQSSATKATILEVMPPEGADEPHILCYHEE